MVYKSQYPQIRLEMAGNSREGSRQMLKLALNKVKSLGQLSLHEHASMQRERGGGKDVHGCFGLERQTYHPVDSTDLCLHRYSAVGGDYIASILVFRQDT